MYLRYLLPISFGLTGGILYKQINNKFYNFYDINSVYINSLFNYGMLIGLGIGTSLSYFKFNNKLLLKLSD